MEKKEKQTESIMEQLARYQKPMEKMYFIFLAVILIYNFLGTTIIIPNIKYYMTEAFAKGMPYDLAEMMVENIFNLRYLIMIPALYTLVYEVKNNKKRILMILLMLIGWFYAFYWRERNDTAVFEMLLLIVASAEKDFRKIARLGIIIMTSLLIVTFALSMVGLLPDFINTRGGDAVRHSFGIIYCTDLAAHWCFVILLYVFIKDGVMKWPAYLIMLILTVLNIWLVDGRLSYLCVTLAAAASLFYTLYVKKGWKVSDRLLSVWRWGLLSSFIVLGGIYMILNWTYTDDPNMFYHRIHALENLGWRLETSHRVTSVIPFSWFGKYFIQIGDGFDSAANAGLYTFLDCSYVRVYVMYGVVAFVLVLAIYTGIQYRLLKKKQTLRMFIMAVIALNCFLEHRMIDTAYNLFILLPFVSLDRCDQAGVSVNGDSEQRKGTD
ncbi:MAG: hypothetical protein J6X66_12875 [Lachnospiraceae bacterium]|nr:hypothetical protein [Lachnospiraceae bacterium]